MPWKFIVLLVILILFVVFIGLNLEHKTDISLGFYSFDNVPAFFIVIVSFLIGSVVTIPIYFLTNMTKRSKSKNKAKKKTQQESLDDNEKEKKKKRK